MEAAEATMTAPAFERLAKTERDRMVESLFSYQHDRCYICGELLDLMQPVDVDHMRALDRGGTDDPNNWGLTHASCNRAKGNRDLDLQRYLSRFQKARKVHLFGGQGDETFTVAVALSLHGGATRGSVARLERNADGHEDLIVTWETADGPVTRRLPVHTDLNNSAVKSVTAVVPIEYVFHDIDINPRSIVDLEPFIEEFYRGHPQLLPSLAHLTVGDGQTSQGRLLLFDGQHKAAAQLFLGNRALYLRIFINSDLKLLKATNFGAHTKLAQIHFPLAIQDKVGDDIFRTALATYLNSLDDRSRVLENSLFKTLGKEERSEMRAHFQGHLKFRVVAAVGSESGQFFDYVETVSARSKTKPLAYETVRKAIFNNFLCLSETDVQLDLAMEMRDRERDNLAALLGLFTAKTLKGHFDLGKGIYKIEEQLATDPSIRDPHLRAYRICRQAPLIVVVRELRQAMAQLLSIRGRYQEASWDRDQVLWAEIHEADWSAVGKMLDAILSHKVWIERNSAYTPNLQDTRQKSWEEILLKGKLPGAAQPVYQALDHSVLLRHASK
jgi:hypothetical protein